MSIARKLALLEAANEAQAIIVEDDYDGEFYFGELAQPPLKSIDTYDRVIYVGTFSKTLFPSLRLGFILAPQNLVSIFDQVFSSWISGPPTSTQAIVADFMDEGQFATHIRLMRKLYKTRYEELMDASQSLPETIKVQQTTSGFHTTAYLDKRVNIDEVITQAAEKGVTIAPISRYCLQPIAQNGLVLGFGSTNPSDIQASLNILGSLPALHK
jgi:GntR family transcriptional regulator/MocR family aminotransferase